MTLREQLEDQMAVCKSLRERLDKADQEISDLRSNAADHAETYQQVAFYRSYSSNMETLLACVLERKLLEAKWRKVGD